METVKDSSSVSCSVVGWDLTEWGIATVGAGWAAYLGARGTQTLFDHLGPLLSRLCDDAAATPTHAPSAGDDDEAHPCPEWLWSVNICVNWGIVGAAGSGKSTLINTLRNLRPNEQGAALVGTIGTTLEPRPYMLPDSETFNQLHRREIFRIWDLPVAGTADIPAATYVKDMGLRHFDVIIIVTRDRITEIDTDMMLLRRLRDFGVPTLLVRNKVDIDIENGENDHNRSQEETLSMIRDYTSQQAGVPWNQVYLIAANKVMGTWHRDPLRLDFDRLLPALVHLTAGARTLAPHYWVNRACRGDVPRFFWAVENHDMFLRKLIQSDHCRLFQNARVVRVVRNENPPLYRHYSQTKQRLVQRQGVRPVTPMTPAFDAEFVIDGSINEVFLWHGTRSANIDAIMSQGLDDRLASRTRNLYGSGLYFACQACKALQYAERFADGTVSLLLCRVILGEAYHAKDTISPQVRRPLCIAYCNPKILCRHQRFDSVVANPGIPRPGGVQIHHEFIVHDRAQTYPEFIVTVAGAFA